MINKENNFISAVVYLDSKKKETLDFLQMLAKILEINFLKSEIICVDDGISQDILEALHSMHEKFPNQNITVIHMGFTHGLESAMNAGTDLAIGDFVFQFNTCFIDYNQSLIMEVYRKSLEGYDIVNAVPPEKSSRLSSKIFYRLYNNFSDSDYELCTERFSIISRRAINRVSSYSKTIPYRKAVYTSSGLQIVKLKYKQTAEETNKVRKRLKKEKQPWMDALILFTDIAYKVAIFCTLLMLLFMFGMALYTVLAYFGKNKPVEGWAPIMGLISVGFFAVFFLFSIIIKYLDVLLKLVFKKQKYLISSVEKL